MEQGALAHGRAGAPHGPAPATMPAPDLSTPITARQARLAIELALRLGDPAAARRASGALCRCFPEAIAPLVLIARALLDLGDARSAIEHFRRALARNPLDAVAWAGLAAALACCDQHTASNAALARAALHDPLGSESLAPGIVQPPQPLSLGVIYLRRGMAELAAAELAATLAQHPQRDDLRLYYAEALRRTGDHAAARRQLSAIAPADPPGLPFLLLSAALGTDSDAIARLQARCARYDPDGQLTRLFFAPELPPWQLPAPPPVPWDDELAAIAGYLPLLPATPGHPASILDDQRSHGAGQKSAAFYSHTLRPGGQGAPGSTAGITLTTGEPPVAARPDPEVSAFVATTERLRRRLAAVSGDPGPLIPWSDGRRLTQVVLGCKAALVRRYGEAGFAAIDRRLHALAAAFQRRGVTTYCCYIDDAASLRIDDQAALAAVPPEAPAIRDLVRTLAAMCADRQRELRMLVLIGGDDLIPFHRLPNPLPDGDEAVLSDNLYASDDAGYLLPQRIVARIPEGAGADPALLLALLDQMLDWHTGRVSYSSIGGLRVPLFGIRAGAAPAHALAPLGYSAEVWRATSRAVLDALDPEAPLYSSPPLDADTLETAALLDHHLLYLNLHGAAGLPNWYGQPAAAEQAARLPVALRPEQLAGSRSTGGLLISEACYGLDLAGRTPANSIPLRALLEGTRACVGATVNAYGGITPPLLGADLLCQRLLTHLARGAPVGEALYQARLEFAQTMYRRQGYLDDVDIKTLIEFVLLGDPWAGAAPGGATVMWPSDRVASLERVPKPRPKAVLLEEQVPHELVRRARDALKRLLPGATTAPLVIMAQPNPRRLRKGEAEHELVFSAQESRPTADGHVVAQTAHVTIKGRAVVKAVLTR